MHLSLHLQLLTIKDLMRGLFLSCIWLLPRKARDGFPAAVFFPDENGPLASCPRSLEEHDWVCVGNGVPRLKSSLASPVPMAMLLRSSQTPSKQRVRRVPRDRARPRNLAYFGKRATCWLWLPPEYRLCFEFPEWLELPNHRI